MGFYIVVGRPTREYQQGIDRKIDGVAGAEQDSSAFAHGKSKPATLRKTVKS